MEKYISPEIEIIVFGTDSLMTADDPLITSLTDDQTEWVDPFLPSGQG
ncbi:MAG: hypothetical protein IKR73_09490 [Oscillospiraceae bacterium]|nr:hypothetical protein [Oscillospiraceae bacterium]